MKIEELIEKILKNASFSIQPSVTFEINLIPEIGKEVLNSCTGILNDFMNSTDFKATLIQDLIEKLPEAIKNVRDKQHRSES